MRSTMVMLLVTASMIGCAAQVPEGESEGATAATKGSTASPLQIGGLGVAQCPGGRAPACVVCATGKCEWACAGGKTCNVEGSICTYSPDTCRTLSFSPGFGGAVMY
jgi:hypothetical protein